MPTVLAAGMDVDRWIDRGRRGLRGGGDRFGGGLAAGQKYLGLAGPDGALGELSSP